MFDIVVKEYPIVIVARAEDMYANGAFEAAVELQWISIEQRFLRSLFQQNVKKCQIYKDLQDIDIYI